MQGGIDEVGKGALAGPVTIGCIAFPREILPLLERDIAYLVTKHPLRDSKQLSARQRHFWYNWLRDNQDVYHMHIATYHGSSDDITQQGITKTLRILCTNASEDIHTPAHIVLDGRLALDAPQGVTWQSYPKADETSLAVTLASIYAKETRDALMREYHQQYPCYQFLTNVGYGTYAHRQAIQNHGMCPIHRKGWCSIS